MNNLSIVFWFCTSLVQTKDVLLSVFCPQNPLIWSLCPHQKAKICSVKNFASTSEKVLFKKWIFRQGFCANVYHFFIRKQLFFNNLFDQYLNSFFISRFTQSFTWTKFLHGQMSKSDKYSILSTSDKQICPCLRNFVHVKSIYFFEKITVLNKIKFKKWLAKFVCLILKLLQKKRKTYDALH
jgi:hypothetical protein